MPRYNSSNIMYVCLLFWHLIHILHIARNHHLEFVVCVNARHVQTFSCSNPLWTNTCVTFIRPQNLKGRTINFASCAWNNARVVVAWKDILVLRTATRARSLERESLRSSCKRSSCKKTIRGPTKWLSMTFLILYQRSRHVDSTLILMSSEI